MRWRRAMCIAAAVAAVGAASVAGAQFLPDGMQMMPRGSKPSLLFTAPAAGAYSSITPSRGPAITCARTSTGTYQTSATSLATAAIATCRVDYRGLLVEESRTNLALQSAGMNAAAWVNTSNTGSVTVNADQTAAPDGTTSADLLTYAATISTAGSYELLRQSGFSFTSGTSYAESFWLKQNATIASIGVTLESPPTYFAILQTSVGASWARVSKSGAAPGTASGFFDIGGNQLAGGPATTVVAGSIYAWGADTEAGPFATSYIPTTTTSVTRSPDQIDVGAVTLSATPSLSATVNLEGLPASSAEVLQAYNSSSDRLSMVINADGTVVCDYFNGSSFTWTSVATVTPGVAARLSCSYDGTNLKTCVAGACTSSPRSFTPPASWLHFYIGSFAGSSHYLNGFLSTACASKKPGGCS